MKRKGKVLLKGEVEKLNESVEEAKQRLRS